MNLLDIFHGAKLGDMGLQVLGRVQLQTFPLEGEDLGGGGHVCILNPESDDEEQRMKNVNLRW